MNGLAYMIDFNRIGSLQVGDGSGDFEDAVVGAGAEIELVHGGAQEFAGFLVDRAVCFQQP